MRSSSRGLEQQPYTANQWRNCGAASNLSSSPQQRSSIGLWFTLLYIVTSYLGPADQSLQLATYHIEVWIAIIALVASLPNFVRSRMLRLPHTYFLAAVIVFAFVSNVMNHWVGGGILALQTFLPNVIVFFLLLANCTSARQLRLLLTTLVLLALFLASRAVLAYTLFRSPTNPLLLYQPLGEDIYLIRVRALSFLKDPNDFAQFLISVLPFLWLAWRPRHAVRNLFVTTLPTLGLLVTVYLTHSRGAMIALAIILILLLKGKLGTVSSAGLALVAFASMLVLNFGGGRVMSFSEGTERLEAWSAGLEMLRSSPLFGVGFGRFTDYYSHTAHSAFLLCAAELGVIGYFFWLASIVFTIGDFSKLRGWQNAKRQRARTPPPVTAETEISQPAQHGLRLPDADLRLARITQVSLLGFLTAGLFLSRSYSMTLYLLLAIVTISNLLDPTFVDSIRARMLRLFMITLLTEGLSISFIYLAVRLHWSS